MKLWEKKWKSPFYGDMATYPWFVWVLVQECNKQGWVTNSTITSSRSWMDEQCTAAGANMTTK